MRKWSRLPSLNKRGALAHPTRVTFPFHSILYENRISVVVVMSFFFLSFPQWLMMSKKKVVGTEKNPKSFGSVFKLSSTPRFSFIFPNVTHLVCAMENLLLLPLLPLVFCAGKFRPCKHDTLNWWCLDWNFQFFQFFCACFSKLALAQ